MYLLCGINCILLLTYKISSVFISKAAAHAYAEGFIYIYIFLHFLQVADFVSSLEAKLKMMQLCF